MYQVSDSYKIAMRSEEQEHSIRGTIGRFSFGRENILRGSLSITNQCSDNSEIKIGQVYIGEFKATFLDTAVPRYSWKGLDITVYFGLKIAGGIYEEIPLGIFTVSEADWTSSGVAVTAYDYMAKFDKKYNGKQTFGDAYTLAAFACEQCGVEFGMTEDEMASFPNGDIILSIYSENDIETWRDYLSWLAQTLGCFATINRTGQLVFRPYGGEPVDTIDDSHRFTGASFSDYETRYTGMSVVDIKTETTAYYNVEPDNGLTYNLGSNPFLQYGTEEMYEARRLAVLGALQNINYVPFKATAIGNPAYDLGDVLIFSDGIADGTKKSCLTKYVFRYNNKYEMQGVGKDPALSSAKSKSDKNIAGLRANMQAKNITVYTYTNIQAMTIKDTRDTDIISINFATVEDTKPVFIATVPLTMSVDGYVVLTYWMDGAQLQEDTLRVYLERGEHFLTISNNFSMLINTRRTLLVKMRTEYYESDTRQQAAKILSFEQYITTGNYTEQAVDTTPPVASIAANSIRAALYAQGLAATEEWDGTINIAEYITPMELPLLSIVGFTATSSLQDTTGPKKGITESFAAFNLPMLPIVGVVALPALNQTVDNYTFDAENCQNYSYNEAYVTAAEGAYRLKTEYEFAAIQQDIEEGQLYIVTIETSQFASVQSIELFTMGGGDRKYLICAENVYYHVSDGELTEITIEEPTADDFASYGNSEIPDGALLLGLTDPQVLCWTDGEELLIVTANVTATPEPQTIVSGTIDLSHELIKGIENITADCEGPLILAVSFDDQETWKAWNGSEWITLSEETSGMSKETLEAVTADQWQQLYQGADNLYIRIALINEEQSISEVRINFVNQEGE